MPSTKAPRPQDLLVLAIDVAREAGTLVRASAGRVQHVGTKSSAVDLVTEADRAVEQLIVRRILEARPDDGIEGEEGGARVGSSGVRWIIDPIDGTTNFVYDVPAYAISIAAELEGERVSGVVFDVSRNELFSAARGAGAFLDGRAIRAGTLASLETALIGTGFSYQAERRAEQARVLATLLPAVRDIRRHGAASVDLCWVACGRLDGYYEAGLQPWDLAAGEVIVREAGGRLGGLGRTTTTTETLVAAGPAMFEALRELLVGAGAR